MYFTDLESQSTSTELERLRTTESENSDEDVSLEQGLNTPDEGCYKCSS